MYFESIEALLNMSGHGVYVWSSVAVTLAAMLWLVSAPLLNHRALLKEVNRDIQRQQDRELALKATVPTENHKESH